MTTPPGDRYEGKEIHCVECGVLLWTGEEFRTLFDTGANLSEALARRHAEVGPCVGLGGSHLVDEQGRPR